MLHDRSAIVIPTRLESSGSPRPIKSRCAHGIDAGPVIQPLLENRTAEAELMRSFDPANVIENGRHWTIVLSPRRRAPAAKDKCPSRRDGNDFSGQRSHVRTKVGPVLVIVV